MITETKCSTHPDAQHGFDRNGSHMAGHYVCECSGWTPPDPKSIQERLRDGADICYARNIQLDCARVVTEAADRIDALENKVDRLEWENKGIAEWCDEHVRMKGQRDEYRKCADNQAMAHKVERDELQGEVARLKRTLINVHNNGANWSGQTLVREALGLAKESK